MQLKSIGYPSGKLISYSYDSIGRLTRVGQGATSYLTINSADYTAAGQVKLMTMGNGVTGAYTFNDHLQLDSLKYKLGTTELLNLAYKYGAANGGNNGQIQGIDNNTGGANKPRESVTYTYDDWSRLQRAQTNDLSVAPTGQPKAWALTWDYDRYGNRRNQNLVGGNLEVTAPQLSISTASNRITTTGYTYDANGNLTSDSLHNYTYDAENRLVTVDSTAASYAYDGNGIRVKRTTGTTVRIIIFSGTKPIAEYLGTSLRREYIYAASQLLVRLDTSGSTTTTTYSHPDHLSARLETNTSGVVTRSFGHLPFGDIWYETGTIEKFKFTSYERDTESNLDYATFRFSSSRLGRFMSADPLGGSRLVPQTLNRYSYVANDPVNRVDPLGLFLGVDPPDFSFFIELLLDSLRPNYVPLVGPPDGPLEKEFKKAKKLADKQKCLDFIASVIQAATLAIAGKASSSDLAPAEQGIFNKTASDVLNAAQAATVISKKNENPTDSGGFRTAATADFFASPQTITLYSAFYEQSTTGRAQVLLHEGVHVVFPFSDAQSRSG